MNIYLICLSGIILCHFTVISFLTMLSVAANVLFYPNSFEAKIQLSKFLNKIQMKKVVCIAFRTLTLLMVVAWTALTLDFITNFDNEAELSSLIVILIGILSAILSRKWYGIALILMTEKIGITNTGEWFGVANLESEDLLSH